MSSANRNYTSVSQNTNTEYVRKGQDGLELVTVKDGVTTVIPVETVVTVTKRALSIGITARRIDQNALLRWNCNDRSIEDFLS